MLVMVLEFLSILVVLLSFSVPTRIISWYNFHFISEKPDYRRQILQSTWTERSLQVYSSVQINFSLTEGECTTTCGIEKVDVQDICILMYKVKHNLCPRTICDMFLTNSHTYNLRQKDFYQPSFNTITHGKHSIRYLGPRL